MFYRLIILQFIIIISSTQVLASCFSFLPYAFNGEYVYLPTDLEFCYKHLDGEIFIKTNKNSGRLINYEKNNLRKKILAFGDSQLLGVDFSQLNKTEKHDLEVLFPDYLIEIYAAPNNGPNQSLMHINELKKSITNKEDHIVVSFNYGTDIFRVLNEWNVENFVPLDEESLKTVLKNSYVYDLIILKGVIEGKFFSIKKDLNNSNLNYYLNIEKNKLNKDLAMWLRKLNDVINQLDNRKTLIIYPPYWGFEKSKNSLISNIKKDYDNFICRDDLHNVFSEIIFAEIKSELTLTGDQRHLASSSLNYFDSSKICL